MLEERLPAERKLWYGAVYLKMAPEEQKEGLQAIDVEVMRKVLVRVALVYGLKNMFNGGLFTIESC